MKGLAKLVPDTGVEPPPYCPSCLDRWRAGMLAEMHAHCRDAIAERSK